MDRLKIEQAWMNVYHGGTIASPYDQHLSIDNVVIARQYIGPIVMRAACLPHQSPEQIERETRKHRQSLR